MFPRVIVTHLHCSAAYGAPRFQTRNDHACILRSAGYLVREPLSGKTNTDLLSSGLVVREHEALFKRYIGQNLNQPGGLSVIR